MVYFYYHSYYKCFSIDYHSIDLDSGYLLENFRTICFLVHYKISRFVFDFNFLLYEGTSVVQWYSAHVMPGPSEISSHQRASGLSSDICNTNITIK